MSVIDKMRCVNGKISFGVIGIIRPIDIRRVSFVGRCGSGILFDFARNANKIGYALILEGEAIRVLVFLNDGLGVLRNVLAQIRQERLKPLLILCHNFL